MAYECVSLLYLLSLTIMSDALPRSSPIVLPQTIKRDQLGSIVLLIIKLHILSFWSHLRSQANTYLGGEIQGKHHSIQLTMLQQAVGYVG